MPVDSVTDPLHPARGEPTRGEPTWEVVHLYPTQGDWTVDAFFSVFDRRGYELVDGVVEKLPVPTKEHQRLAKWLLYRLDHYLTQHGGGEAFMMGYRTRTVDQRYREPDVVYISDQTASTSRNAEAADLVIEVVSDAQSDRQRDLVVKRNEYQTAGVPEYWIVDRLNQQILVLSLEDGVYREATFGSGDQATSVLLDGFRVDVCACFAAAE